MNNLIIHCLNTHYSIKVESLTLLPIGADPNATLFKVQALAATYFVKIKQGHQEDISVNIISLLSDAGLKEIIVPIRTIDGGLTQRQKDDTVIVYPFIAGQDGFHCTLTENQWRRLGKALRQIHDIAVPPSIQKRLRRETYSSKWRDAVRSLYVHFEKMPEGDEVSLKLWQFIQGHVQTIHKLVDRAHQLARQLQDQSQQVVLCHSDLHAGNILIGEEGSFYIVDWDDPILAPKERDLMFMGGGVGNVWNKPSEEKLFYDGYGPTQVNQPLLAYYRNERIVEDIAIYGQALLLQTSGGNDRIKMYQDFVGMFEPNGVVEIALKSF